MLSEKTSPQGVAQILYLPSQKLFVSMTVSGLAIYRVETGSLLYLQGVYKEKLD